MNPLLYSFLAYEMELKDTEKTETTPNHVFHGRGSGIFALDRASVVWLTTPEKKIFHGQPTEIWQKTTQNFRKFRQLEKGTSGVARD